MTYEMPGLPYAIDALAPYISAETVEYHHGKHQKAYVDNLNKLIQGTEYQDMALTDIIRKAPAGPIFNNAAQAWNHAFYWESLAPAGDHEDPDAHFLSVINRRFQSLDEFKSIFSQTAIGNFGSGWTWLVKTPEGKLDIVNTSNAGTPLTTDATPLLTCDVWEHAYYIDYRNRRADYLVGFWRLINWKKVAERFNG